MRSANRSASTAIALGVSFLVLMGIGLWWHRARTRPASDIVGGPDPVIARSEGPTAIGVKTGERPLIENPVPKEVEPLPKGRRFPDPGGEEASRYVDLRVVARTMFDGRSAEGVGVAAQRIAFSAGGERGLVTRVFSRATRRIFEGTDLSDSGGHAEAVARLAEDEVEDAMLAVAAYKPEFGSAYIEVDAASIRDGSLIELNLDAGRSIRGRVVDRGGNRVANAFVCIGTRSPLDGVAQIGIGAITDSEGVFEFAGVREDNVPGQLSITCPARLAVELTGEERREAIRDRRIDLQKFGVALDSETRVYDLGEVVFSPPR